MPLSNGTRLYARSDFAALTGAIPIDLLRSRLSGLPQTVTIIDVRFTPQQDGVIVEWLTFPGAADVQAVDDSIATFAGGTTSSAPLEVESLGITSATSSALVDVIDTTTPPLDAGTYQVFWNSLVGMLAAVANTGVRGVITLTRIRGAANVSRQWEHNWTMQQPQLFGGGITFQCAAGDRIRVLLQVGKVGTPAATAQMAMARITIDQI